MYKHKRVKSVLLTLVLVMAMLFTSSAFTQQSSVFAKEEEKQVVTEGEKNAEEESAVEQETEANEKDAKEPEALDEMPGEMLDDAPEFVEMTTIKVKCKWVGGKATATTFSISTNGGTEDVYPLNEENDWTLMLELPKYDITGELNSYEVLGAAEVEGFNLVTSGNNEDGYVFKYISRKGKPLKVTHKWVGGEEKSYSFSILDHGQVINMKELTEENNWTYTGIASKYNLETGELAEYSILADEVEGYTTTVTGSLEDGFIITSTKIGATTKPGDTTKPGATTDGENTNSSDTPKTGDTTNLGLLLMLSLASLGTGATVFVLKRRKEQM